MELTFTKENSTLKVALKGRLDATSAPEVEAKLNEQLAGIEKVVFDASELEYVSSAGLRVILKTKRSIKDTSVINTSNDVYDIFEMTGFSEMMEVSKKQREISVEGCEVIGRGYFGTVYRISKDTIVKVYSDKMPYEGIVRERELARKAFVLGVPTAIPYDIVKVGNQYGSVFELLDAETLQKKIINDLEHVDDYIKQYTNTLKIIHSTEIKPGEITDKKQEALEWAKEAALLLDKKTGDKLVKLVEGIKEDYHLLHGDYHVKNIMVQNGDPFIIDMDTLATGAPIFELGFMYSCYTGYQEIHHENAFDFFGIEYDVLQHIFNKTVHDYFEGKGEAYIEQIIKKARIVSYVQLIPKFERHGDHPDELALFKKEIVGLVEEIDDLNF